MNVLIDFHHADLAESLHILFVDRFGWDVFIPAGHDWWDAGYWQFGISAWSDDRLAQQFLTCDNVRGDDSHPERERRCVTLAEALQMPWDYVVATVPDNYAGYANFAQLTGAKFVVQVGNVNQPNGWQYHPIILEGPQEFSLQTFRYEPPTTTTRVITSMVNCVDRLPCYPLLTEAMEALPDFDWRIHGIDGADGNVKPVAKIADVMRASGWAWHDKVTGDGFGHVIHNWAAVGRPLIGHSHHYQGQPAEAFWEDGVTCIDLDRHSVPEAAQIVRETGPEAHRAMCMAIRHRFDTTVDFDAHAEKVRELLG